MAYATQTQSLSGNVLQRFLRFASLSEAAERRHVYKTTYAELASHPRANCRYWPSKANIGAIAYEAA